MNKETTTANRFNVKLQLEQNRLNKFIMRLFQ